MRRLNRWNLTSFYWSFFQQSELGMQLMKNETVMHDAQSCKLFVIDLHLFFRSKIGLVGFELTKY